MRCAYCGARAGEVFCCADCEQIHRATGRELVEVDVDAIERVARLAAAAGAGYAMTWDTLLDRVVPLHDR